MELSQLVEVSLSRGRRSGTSCRVHELEAAWLCAQGRACAAIPDSHLDELRQLARYRAFAALAVLGWVHITRASGGNLSLRSESGRELTVATCRASDRVAVVALGARVAAVDERAVVIIASTPWRL